MNNIMKHVGLHSRQKVAVVYQVIPGEEHMCLVVYTDALPKIPREEVEKVLNSNMGQESAQLADALFKHFMPDGQQCLTFLHTHGLLKKVNTDDVTMVLNTKTSIQLSTLNKHIKTLNESKNSTASLSKEVQDAVDAASGTLPMINPPVAPPNNTELDALKLVVATLENRLALMEAKLGIHDYGTPCSANMQTSDAIIDNVIPLEASANGKTPVSKPKRRGKVAAT